MTNVNNTVTPNTQLMLQGAGKCSFGGVLIGSFRDGINVTYAAEYSYTRSDYTIGELQSEATNATCEVNTILEETSTRNLCIAFGGNTSSSSSSSSSIIWDFGPELAQNPQVLKFLGQSEKSWSQYRRVEFYRAQRIGSTAVPFRRGVETLAPVTWKCFQNANSKFLKVTDPVADL